MTKYLTSHLNLSATILLILTLAWNLNLSPVHAAPRGETDGNAAKVSDQTIEDNIDPGAPKLAPLPGPIDGHPVKPAGKPRKTRVPEFSNFKRRAADHGRHNCRTTANGGLDCKASRTACSASVDYTVDPMGDVVATPTTRRSNPGKVTYASVTRNNDSGKETINGYTCEDPAERSQATRNLEGAPVVITVTQRDFATLPVKPSTAHAGPDKGWLPVNMVNVLYADPAVQTLDTELLGTPVQVRAIPTEYHWDLGDGNTITTSKPGKPFPSEQVSATYTQEGWYDITLTTTFVGQFSVAGGEWQDIDGTIEVKSDPVALYSKSLESRLVDGDVPVDEEKDPWIPERSPDTKGPRDPAATNRRI